MTKKTIESWKKLKNELQIGQIISGVVFKIEHYGIYVDIGKDFHGIVLAPYISKEIIEVKDYPKIGEVVTGIIIHFSERNNPNEINFNYVVLSIKDYKI